MTFNFAQDQYFIEKRSGISGNQIASGLLTEKTGIGYCYTADRTQNST